MRFLIVIMLLPFLTFSQQSEKEILENRELHQTSLSDTSYGILTIEDLEYFEKVQYYDFDSSYQLKVSFNKDKGKWFEMPTSTERLPVYRRFGYVTFTMDSIECQLTVYQNKDLRRNKEYKDYLFIPFRDKTSRVTTYGGGRYLDVRIPKDNELLLDFNLAYNPYCAYSHRYSCPIPPEENSLIIEVKAGEKTPIGH